MAEREKRGGSASPRPPVIDTEPAGASAPPAGWKRRLRTGSIFISTNGVFWFVFLSPFRVVCLVLMGLVLLILAQLVRDLALSRAKGCRLWRSMTGSWEMVDSGQDGSTGAESQVSDCWMSIKLFLEETSSFKQQNPGKFCLLVCSLCFFLAVLGNYIPGVVISYMIVLGIFLWPVMSSHELGLWFEPVLQKLDFGVGSFLQRVKENHERRLLHAQAEKSIEADLSLLFPKMDSTVCKEMCVSDTEVSDVTWTDNNTFNLSEGHTPQTENSEDLDRRSEEEVFSGGLADFPSLDNGTNGEDDDDLSIGLPNTSFLQTRAARQIEATTATQVSDFLQRTAGDAITAAVSAAIQERLETAAPDDTDSEYEDFELLDQSELEHLEGELCLEKASGELPSKGSKQAGFFSKLLGQQ